tara:strand:- start:8062 stop:8343 length:282 start_codon:yes stop_codon:yes gene_type:complete
MAISEFKLFKLRQIIRRFILESTDNEEIKKEEDIDLILEPDLSAEDDRSNADSPDEASTVAGMASGMGPNVPMGKTANNFSFSSKNSNKKNKK